MRAAVDDDEPLRRRGANPDRLRRAAVAPAGRGPRSASGVGDADRRTMNDHQDRDPVLDEADIDSELAIFGDKLPGSVERVNSPEARGRRWQALGLDQFPRGDRDVGEGFGQHRTDDLLRGKVGSGHWRLVGLLLKRRMPWNRP
jgi:hypothetical protein